MMRAAGFPSIGRAWLVAAALLAGALFPAAAPALTINYPDFTSTSGLNLNGDAATALSALRLVPDTDSQSGSAFTDDARLRSTRSFKTRFRAQIHGSLRADGLAFVLQDDASGADALGPAGSELGYGGIAPSLAVEMDIYSSDGDPLCCGSNHIAVTEGGDEQVHEKFAEPPFDLKGEPFFAWVDYSASKRKLKVYARRGQEKPNEPLFAYRRNLSKVFDDQKLFAGFTAATGGDFAAHDLLSWKLTQ